VWQRLVEGVRSGGLYIAATGQERVAPVDGAGLDGASEQERYGNIVTVARVGIWWMGISIENINGRQHDVTRVLTRLGMQHVRRRASGRLRWFWVLTDEGRAKMLAEGGWNSRSPVPPSSGENSDQWNLIPE
jgi:hypothetical protein